MMGHNQLYVPTVSSGKIEEWTTCLHASICRPSCRRTLSRAAPRPARARAQRLPGRRRPGRRQGRSLPGPGPGGHRRRDPATAGALVPWICDALLSNHSVKAYGRDLMDFVRHMQAQGVTPLDVTADHVKMYKRALLGSRPDIGDGRPAAIRPPRHLPAARGQGARHLGDGPGHRRGQGPRRPEELHPVADPEAGDSRSWRRSRPTPCRGSATWP